MAYPLPEQKYCLSKSEKQKVKPFSIGSYWLKQGEYRLDASFYAEEAFFALRTLQESGFKLEALGELAEDIFYPTRFKRIWSDEENGFSFIGSQEILALKPPKEKFISKRKTKDLEKIAIKPNWVLITRSGSVGRSVFVNQTLSKYLISEHVIRIIPNKDVFSGYIYSLASSKFGRALLLKHIFGSTVSEIEPHHVANIPIPIIPLYKQEEIHNQIVQAYKLRDEANVLLDRAESLMYEELELPEFSERNVRYISDIAKVRAFSIKASELDGRFDSSYHNPIAKNAIKNLHKGKYPLVRLEEITEKIFIPPRFKRIYVSKDYGIPFLQGSHIPQMKPHDLKYLSKTLTKNLDNWIIKSGWVMVTCSGTIGRIALSPKSWNNWAASQHILRIIPKTDLSNAGFITAFLSSPYGQHQLISKIYGGVVDEITEDDTKNIFIPNPPTEIQEKIGNLFVEAFEKKEEANTIENNTITELENILAKK